MTFKEKMEKLNAIINKVLHKRTICELDGPDQPRFCNIMTYFNYERGFIHHYDFRDPNVHIDSVTDLAANYIYDYIRISGDTDVLFGEFDILTMITKAVEECDGETRISGNDC